MCILLIMVDTPESNSNSNLSSSSSSDETSLPSSSSTTSASAASSSISSSAPREVVGIRTSSQCVLIPDATTAVSPSVESVMVINPHNDAVEVFPIASAASSQEMLSILPTVSSSSSQQAELLALQHRLESYLQSPSQFSISERADLCRIFAQAMYVLNSFSCFHWSIFMLFFLCF